MSDERALRLMEDGADANARRHTPFHVACWDGREDLVSFWLCRGADPDQRGLHGDTGLHLAANGGHEGVVRMLLAAGAAVGATDEEGLTPIHEACTGGFRSVAQLLLDHGADILAVTRKGVTPLHLACMHGGDVWYAIGAGARVSAVDNDLRTPLHYAAKYGHECTVLQLLRAGADRGARDKFGHVPAFWAWEAGFAAAGRAASEGMSVEPEWLRAACGEDHIDCVLHLIRMGCEPCSLLLAKGSEVALALLDAGADIDVQDARGNTALHFACSKGRDALAMSLLARGANANATNAFGRTPVHLCRSVNVLEALVAAGADVNVRDDRGACPLQQMCVTGSDELVRAMIRAGADAKSCGPLQLSRSATITVALLEAGADPNVTDHSGATALHRACVEGKPDVAHQLVLRGANVSAADDRGKTPMHYAVLGASIDCANYLISCGADPGRADHCGTTPLHTACSLGKIDMAIILLRAGASPSAMDDDETNPMDPLRIACDNNFPDEPLLAMMELVEPSHIAAHSAELLCALCYHGRFDTALLFVQRGADPFQTHPRTGSCAIKDACTRHGGSKFLSAFLTPDDVRTSCAGNMTLLHLACVHRVTDAAALLVRLGADTRAIHTPDGKTPLQMADDDQWVQDMLLLASQ